MIHQPIERCACDDCRKAAAREDITASLPWILDGAVAALLVVAAIVAARAFPDAPVARAHPATLPAQPAGAHGAGAGIPAERR